MSSMRPQRLVRQQRRSRKIRNSRLQGEYSGLADLFGGMTLAAPTVGEIQQSLRSQRISGPTPIRRMDPWVHCRVDPFTSEGGTQKPDGQGGARSVIVDHLVADTITCLTTAGFTIQTLPGLFPFTAVIVGNGAAAALDISVNGTTYTNNASYFPIGVLTEWANGPTQFQNWSFYSTPKTDPYQSSKCRVLSVKRRMMYTGSTLDNAAFIQVTPNPYSMSATNALVTNASGAAVAHTINVELRDTTGAFLSDVPLNTPLRALDYEVTPAFTKDTVTYRVEQGALITSKQSGATHQMVPMPDSGFAVVANQSLTPPAAGALYSHLVVDALVGGTFPMAAWAVDDTWEGENISVTGPVVGVTFRFETAYCVEYDLQSGSPMAPMGKKPVPIRKAALEKASNMVNSMPSAIPGSAFPR